MTTATRFDFNLPISTLQAALLCAAKKDTRYYINGIYLDCSAGLVVSTDGHRLFAGKAELPQNAPPIIIPRETVEAAIKSLTKRQREGFHAAITIQEKDGANSINGRPAVSISIYTGAATFTADEIDGRYPEYQRIIPLNCSGEVAVYNPDYLADARDALAIYCNDSRGEWFNMAYNGQSAGVVHRGPECAALVVVMPMRSDAAADFPNLLHVERDIRQAA